jgi:RNA ligase-like protein
VSELKFKAWPKIPRWSNETVTITEKIDGTNAAVIILPYSVDHESMIQEGYACVLGHDEPDMPAEMITFATQSRKRFIKPGKDTDNAGFAAWAWERRAELITELGYGKHYGEWWGRGIQRGYGMDTKVFSLFRPWRYEDMIGDSSAVEGLRVVPTLYAGGAEGLLTTSIILATLEQEGSKAAPGYMRPEGIIIQSALTQSTYKAFTWDDGLPKSAKGE